MEKLFYAGRRPDGLWVFGLHLLPGDRLEPIERFESLGEAAAFCRKKRADAAEAAAIARPEPGTGSLFGEA